MQGKGKVQAVPRKPSANMWEELEDGHASNQRKKGRALKKKGRSLKKRDNFQLFTIGAGANDILFPLWGNRGEGLRDGISEQGHELG